MNNNYEHYTMRLTTLGPVFIGDGKELLKKEYILKDNIVMIPDMQKLYQAVCAKRAEKEFARFLTGQEDRDLGFWLRNTGIGIQPSFIKYQFEVDKNMQKDKKSRLKNILTFVKDPYGNPYVPGSSIKGMIRTALLAYLIQLEHNKKSDFIQNKVSQTEQAAIEDAPNQKKISAKRFLKGEATGLENSFFHTLKKTNEKGEKIDWKNAVNSLMQGLIVGDSDALMPTDLILAQKWDINKDGRETVLPIYRESLKPNVAISFSLSLDRRVFPFSLDTILKALKQFNDVSNQHFYKKFGRENRDVNTVYLGGGTGFLSKTVVYPLFQDRGVEMAHQVFKKTLNDNVYRTHKHYKDLSLKLSPHVCKCTKYKGQLYNMGICRIEKIMG